MLERIPPAREADAEDVIWALQTAETLWNRGERLDAIVWLRRAAQAAGEAGDNERAMSLAEGAAELAAVLGDASIPSERASGAPKSAGGAGDGAGEEVGTSDLDDLLSTPVSVDSAGSAFGGPAAADTHVTLNGERADESSAADVADVEDVDDEDDHPSSMPPLESLPAPPPKKHDSGGIDALLAASAPAPAPERAHRPVVDPHAPTYSDLDPFGPQAPRPPAAARLPTYSEPDDVVTSAPPLAMSSPPNPVPPSIPAPLPPPSFALDGAMDGASDGASNGHAPLAIPAAAPVPSPAPPAAAVAMSEPPISLNTIPPSSVDDADLVSIPPPPLAPSPPVAAARPPLPPHAPHAPGGAKPPPPLPPSSTHMRAAPPPVPRPGGPPRPGVPRPAPAAPLAPPAPPAPFAQAGPAVVKPPVSPSAMPLPFVRPGSRPDTMALDANETSETSETVPPSARVAPPSSKIPSAKPPASQPPSQRLAAAESTRDSQRISAAPPPSSRRGPPPLPPPETAALLASSSMRAAALTATEPDERAPASQNLGALTEPPSPLTSSPPPSSRMPASVPVNVDNVEGATIPPPPSERANQHLYIPDPPPSFRDPVEHVVPVVAASPAASPTATLPEIQTPTTPPPPPRFSLDEVEPLNKLSAEAREALVRCAEILSLAPNDEVTGFALALVLQGQVNVAATVAEAPALRAQVGDVLRSGGTAEDQVKIRLVPVGDDVQVATWSDEELARALQNAPEVAEILRAAADHIQVRVGVALGPLGERLDFSLRTEIVDRLTTRHLAEGEVLVERGKPVPGMIVIGAGALELVDGDMVIGEVGPGEFLFADAVLGAGPAPFAARAIKGGATILFGGRLLAQELLVTCPPLLELFAGM